MTGHPPAALLRRLSPEHGWRAELIRDAHGRSDVIVAVTDTMAMRHRTHDDGLILPTELPGTSGAVWQRHGRCEEVLAELFELQEGRTE